VLPGLGHAYVGRPRKGLFLFAVILGTYVGGLLLAEFRCVSWERDPFWFAAQGVAAGPTALVAWLTRDLSIDRRIPTFDVGLLYVSVASLLNAVAVADALGVVDERLAAADAEDAAAARLDAALRAQGLIAGGGAPDGGPAGPPSADAPPSDAPPRDAPPAGALALGAGLGDGLPAGPAAEPPPEAPLLPRADVPDYGRAP
jgi:hypothetical protein